MQKENVLNNSTSLAALLEFRNIKTTKLKHLSVQLCTSGYIALKFLYKKWIPNTNKFSNSKSQKDAQHMHIVIHYVDFFNF